MITHSRMYVLNTLLETGLIPLMYHADSAILQQAVAACFEGGVKAFEFTNRGDFTLETFSAVRKHFARVQPTHLIGVGSIVDAPTAALFIAHGADFIVSPSFNAEVARLCNRRKIAYLPGCNTLTEIGTAEEYGVEIVKLFPGQQYSPEFVKAIKAPCSWTRIMPTGGVEPTQQSIQKWFEAGACAVGIGSQLLSSDRLKREAWDEISSLCSHILGWITQYQVK